MKKGYKGINKTERVVLIFMAIMTLLLAPFFAMAEKQSPSHIIPISNKGWLSRTETATVLDLEYSFGNGPFDAEGFDLFYHPFNREDIIIGLGFESRKENPDTKRYQRYSPHIAFSDLPFGDLSFFYLNYPLVENKKAYGFGAQLSKNVIEQTQTELKLFIRPVYAANQGVNEEEDIEKISETLLLLGADFSNEKTSFSLFGSVASLKHLIDPLEIQTEMIDLTHIHGLQNTSALARYMIGGHAEYKASEKWGVNVTYASLWYPQSPHLNTLYPTVYVHLNKLITLHLGFQRVSGSDEGNKNYGLLGLTLGSE
jgi:hypothetical protein